jgi:hypothetical protein
MVFIFPPNILISSAYARHEDGDGSCKVLRNFGILPCSYRVLKSRRLRIDQKLVSFNRFQSLFSVCTGCHIKQSCIAMEINTLLVSDHAE